MRAFSQIKGAMVFAFAPPAVLELGVAKGFDFQLQDRGGLGHDGALMSAQEPAPGQWPPRIRGSSSIRPNGMEDQFPSTGWTWIGKRPGHPRGSHRNHPPRPIATAFGSGYVNDFIQGGRVKRVFVQADAPLPHASGTSGQVVRSQQVRPAPWFHSLRLASGRIGASGSPKLERYNSLSLHKHLGRAGTGEEVPVKAMKPPWRKSSPSCPKVSGSTGQGCRTRKE